jgi:DedD protein
VDNGQLKQRIVGAIVLVALGVIFIPMILNHDESNIGISGTNIPEKPKELQQLANQATPALPPAPAQPAETRQLVDKDTPPLPPATAPLAQEPSTPVKPETVPETTTKKNSAPSDSPNGSHLDAAKARGWVVQIASFTDRNKALQLRDRLRKAKYTCFVESITAKHGTLYRVRVGPIIKREDADKLQAKIVKQQKLKDALVMAYP